MPVLLAAVLSLLAMTAIAQVAALAAPAATRARSWRDDLARRMPEPAAR